MSSLPPNGLVRVAPLFKNVLTGARPNPKYYRNKALPEDAVQFSNPNIRDDGPD
jgi:hypothetical protein